MTAYQGPLFAKQSVKTVMRLFLIYAGLFGLRLDYGLFVQGLSWAVADPPLHFLVSGPFESYGEMLARIGAAIVARIAGP